MIHPAGKLVGSGRSFIWEGDGVKSAARESRFGAQSDPTLKGGGDDCY